MVVLLSLATATLMAGIAGHETAPMNRLPTTLAMATAMFFFLMRQRATDEFKDAGHDDTNYPNRPIQRGVVTRSQVRNLGLLALAAELASVMVAGMLAGNPTSVVWYLPFLAYSGLTAVEFFAGSWLNRHFNLYFLSHQGIFVVYAIWVFAVFGTALSPASTLGFVFVMMTVEIARKYEVRLDPAGLPVRDTYLTVWGAKTSLIIVALTTELAAWMLAVTHGEYGPLVVSAGLLIAIVTLRRRSRAIQASIMVAFLTQSLVVYVT